MLEFGLHEISLGPRFYILLPKLNGLQMRALKTRLQGQGFVVAGDFPMTARGHDLVVRIDPSGICWSTSDPNDFVVPAIPELLSISKQAIPLEELKRRYFAIEQARSGATVRFEPRLERGSLWRKLRATDQCGLAPDERAVILFLLRFAGGEFNLLTDFPTASSRRKLIGGRQYFESRFDRIEARSTLRSIGTRGTRNSYLPGRGILHLESFTPPTRRDFVELFEGLGEWSYFKPT